MNERLTQEQLNQIITEVQAMQLRQEAELDQQQVREILQDLNLAPENQSRNFYCVTLKGASDGIFFNCGQIIGSDAPYKR